MRLITFIFITCIQTCLCIERVYYIAAVKEEWDYAPNGNLIYSGNPQDTDLYLKRDPSVPTIGTKYKKTVYREFTDGTFKQRVNRPEWLGMIGPFMKAEIGDTFVVHFQNQAAYPYSIHPHGVFYNKDSEGAMYADGSSGINKLDDAVPPGHNYTYIWNVRPEYGPIENDPNCLTWLYHSHDEAEVEVMTGAVGILLTCKKGILDSKGNRRDVDKDFPLLFSIMDENFSPYRSENIREAGITDEAIMANFLPFQVGNRKSSINGYIYGNLKGLDVCLGDKISFHVAGVGNDLDLHSVYLQGQTMVVYKHTIAALAIYPGSSYTADVTAENEGKWILSCQSREYIRTGMQAFFNVKKCNKTADAERMPSGVTRTYYIAAEEVMWRFAPSNRDLVTGRHLTEQEPNSFGRSDADMCRFNGTYKKAIFIGYTDGTFRVPYYRSTRDHLGYLGPVIRAEVGDRIVVHFLNRASRPYSLQAYRYFVKEDNQGIQYKDGRKVGVNPRETRTYMWTVPYSTSPTWNDASCLYGRYYSAVDQVKDTFTGLSGPLLICKKGTLENENVDRSFFLLFSNVQETLSHYWKENVQRVCGRSANAEQMAANSTIVDANTMRSINGYTYGNLPGLYMVERERIMWYVTSAGFARGDLHTPYFHGNTFQIDGTRKDTVALIPDLFKTLEMYPDNPGQWLIEDLIYIFSNGRGMAALYTVAKSQYSRPPIINKGKIRTYYIGIIEEDWNYYPNITHQPVSGLPLAEDPYSRGPYVQSRTTIGHIYIKSFYREFTDRTFTQQKIRTQRELHLGTLGPFIKAHVGDTIRVVFRNMARFNFSLSPHGVFYEQPDAQHHEAVPPNQTVIYEWKVSARAGPSYDDFPCLFWPYMSVVDAYSDVQAGLMGVIVVCKTGILDKNDRRTDVDREFALYYNINNENASPYLDANIEKFTVANETSPLKTDPEWIETNMMMGINGFSFASIRNVAMYLGETAAFYLISFGDPFETHTIHWHGNTFIRQLSGPHRHDVMDVLPGDFNQVKVLGVNKGDWLMHCHVGNHSENGMLMTYQVLDPDETLRISQQYM